MRQIGGVVDVNDYEYVVKHFGEPLIGISAPRKTRKINPQCSKFVLKLWKHGVDLLYLFHVKPIYYYSINCEWRPMTEIAYHLGHHKVLLKENWVNYIHPSFLLWWIKRMNLIKGKLEIPNFALQPAQMLFNVDFFPDPDPETTSVDGDILQSTSASWATIRGAANGNTANPSGPSIDVRFRASTVTNEWDRMDRGITLFDTSSINDGDTIDSATYSIKGANAINNFSQSVVMVDSTPASNTNIVVGDYAQVGTAEQATGRITIASWSTTAYNVFTLSATGLGNISKTGVSKFGYRVSGDFDNIEPTWSSGLAADCSGDSADVAGTAQDPKLAVTSSAAAVVGSSNNLLLMGVGL